MFIMKTLVAFIVFGLILAVIAFIKNRKDELAKNIAKQEKIKKQQEAKAAAAAQAAQEGGNN